ncbi:hypothetical protein CUMW_186740 [Citrus unshiu]|nr:hypothetical protein CUMW_186740 [Citrus unshiu]
MPQSTAKIIAATAAVTLVIARVAFLICQRTKRLRQKNKINSSFHKQEATVTQEKFKKFRGRVKGLVVEEDGKEVLYMRKLEHGELKASFPKIVFNPSFEEDEEKCMDITTVQRSIISRFSFEETSDLTGGERKAEAVRQNPTLPPPASARLLTQPPPPPLPPPPSFNHPLQATLPPMRVKRNPTPASPPPEAPNLASPLKPPPTPRGNTGKIKDRALTEESSSRTVVGHVKLKPLHWDKVATNVDHSMVWNEINDGSLRFDDEQIKNLFGYSTINRRLYERSKTSMSSGSSNAAPTTQLFILEPCKSQNTAIVLRSLVISRKEIIEALLDGQGLSIDILEKLAKISPSQDEVSKILQFNGNPTRLGDAESFLIHFLKLVPSAFTRVNTMIFISNYESEILHLKESLQALEMGCKELRTRGNFLKLLEAILKAGNKMNAGTSRGNAQGFNLSALQKLYDVKSTDGKTTLLHFVVEQVIRSEGRRGELNGNHILGRTNSQRSKTSDSNSESSTPKEKGNEYLKQGLPAVEGLSNEFTNVKKATRIEHDTFINTCSSLASRVVEIRQLVTRCARSERGGFLKEMKGFLEDCEEELKLVRESK